MNQGIYPLAANMINQLNRVDVLSNNLANSTTTGFKEDNTVEGSFNNYLTVANEKHLQTTKINEILNTIPKMDGSYVSEQNGALIPTNNQLDFAIKDENVFFKVKNPKTNETFLTRDGSFKILNGQVVTQNGYQVLNIENQPITAEDDFATQISVVKTQYENLTKQGNNNYQIKSKKDVEKLVGNEEYVLQGTLEKSNVNTVSTMVSLIQSHRNFELAQKAMTGIDDMNKNVIQKIGSAR